MNGGQQKKADIIISVTQRILDVFGDRHVPKLLLNHGVPHAFLNVVTNTASDGGVRVGYSGSLIRNDLDMELILKIVDSYPDAMFEFWGENDYRASSIHQPEDVEEKTKRFIEALRKKHNVILHGAVNSNELAKGLSRMDILLICYNIKNAQNSHKVLEYLATGNVVVSNYMSSFKGVGDGLIEMCANPDNNDEFFSIFQDVINRIDEYNSVELSGKRRAYAARFSYAENISRIDSFLHQCRTA